MFNGTTLPHEFATLTTRQKEKVRNALSNNMSNDLKLSKAEISKIVQSGGFLASLLRYISSSITESSSSFCKKCFI